MPPECFRDKIVTTEYEDFSDVRATESPLCHYMPGIFMPASLRAKLALPMSLNIFFI